MKILQTLTTLAATATLSNAAVIHTSTDDRFDLSFTIETIDNGDLKFVVDFKNSLIRGARLAQFQLIPRNGRDVPFPLGIIGHRINTSDDQNLLVDPLDSVIPTARTYMSAYEPERFGYTQEQYFEVGEQDTFYIEPINERHSYDADTVFAEPLTVFVSYGATTESFVTEVSNVPEPSTALLAALSLLAVIKRKR